MPKRKKGTPNPDAIVADEPATPSFGVGTGVGVQHPMTRHDCDGTLLAKQYLENVERLLNQDVI